MIFSIIKIEEGVSVPYGTETNYWNAVELCESLDKGKSVSAEIVRKNDGFIYYSTAHAKYKKNYERFTLDEWQAKKEIYSSAKAVKSVYIDIDGTAAYWYKDGKGLSYPEEILNHKYHYYRDLEPHKYIIDLALALQEKGVDVCVLTATAREVFSDRWEWIEKNMPFIPKDNIFMCPIGADKNNFCKGNADFSILIDDYEKNLDEWRGKTFKSINNINSISRNHDNIGTAACEAIIRRGDNQEYNRKLSMDVNRIISALERLNIGKGRNVKPADNIKERLESLYAYFAGSAELELDYDEETKSWKVMSYSNGEATQVCGRSGNPIYAFYSIPKNDVIKALDSTGVFYVN